MKNEILEFYNKAAKDDEFLKNLQDFRNENSNAEAKSVIKNVVLPYSKKKGYNFSESELSEIADSNSLSLDDLEQVAGGFGLLPFAASLFSLFSMILGGNNNTTQPVQPGTVQEQTQGQTKISTDTIVRNGCTFLVQFTDDVATILDVISIPENGRVKIPSQSAGRNITSISEKAFEKHKDKLTEVTFDDGCELKSIKKETFSGCSKLSKIDIPEGVVSICSNAFQGCTSIKNITIPEGLLRLGDNAFSQCTSLKEIRIPESLNGNIGAHTFDGCTSLKSVTISSGVSTISEGMFSGCTALNRVEIPETVETINDHAFSKCAALSRVIIHEGVKTIGSYAFSECNSLKDVTIPQTVETINDHAFSKCAALSSVVINEGVETIGSYAFSECNSLKDITIPKTVETINDHAFFKCAALNRVVIPEGVKTIGSYAFSECNSLKDITIPQTVETINDHAFSNCTSLMVPLSLKGKLEANIPENCTKIYHNDSEYIYENNDSSITFNLNRKGDGYIIKRVTKVPSSGIFKLPNRIAGKPVIEIKNAAFAGLKTLKEITIPNSIILIGDNAFHSCTSLEKISIPNSITNIGNNAFYNCTSLKSITIPNSVRSIGSRSFAVCNSLETVDIRGNISGISEYTFAKCKMLKSVKLPNSITEIKENAFARCTSIESFTIPDSVKIIGERAFYECSALQNIAIPFSVYAIGESAFLKCNKLTNAKIPARLSKFIAKRKIFEDTCNKQYVDIIFESNGSKLLLLPNAANNGFTISKFINIPDDGVVTIPPTAYGKPITSMDDNVFKSHQNNLVKVNFEKDCNISYIGNKVFKGCHNLKEVNISTHYTTFSKGAFADCSSLKTANVHADLKGKMENVFPITCTVNYTSDGFVQRFFGKKYATQASEIKRNVTKNSCEFEIAETPDGITITALTKMPKNGIVKIPSEIDGKPIVKLAENAFENSDIKQISFDKGCQISSISGAAFIHCTSLESIVLPDSIVSIDSGAFLNCTNLKSITIPDGVTSISEMAFCGCSSLTNINLPNSLSFIGKMAFANCKSLISITIPASVTSIGEDAFSDFSDSQTIFIADGSKLTNLADNAFENCKAIVSIPESLKDKVDWNNVKINIRQEKCEFYTDTRNMTINSIKKVPANGIVTIPSKVLGEYVEKINKDIFKDNTDIKEIIFEDDCQIKNINKVSFEGCNASIRIPENLVDKIKGENISIRKGNCAFKIIESDENGVTITGIDKIPHNGVITIPSQIAGKAVVSIGNDAFKNHKEIKKVKFEDGCQIKNIGKNAFTGCSNLANIIIPNSVTSIGESAFAGCSNLKNINLDSVTSIGTAAFAGCSNLININLDNVTSIGTAAFEGCSNLKNIRINKVTSLDENVFEGCSNLKIIIVPECVTSIHPDAFSNCHKLKQIIILPDTKLSETQITDIRERYPNVDVFVI